MSKTTKFGIAAAFVLFLILLIYSSLRLGQVRVEVCVTYECRSNCGRAAAPTEEEAIRTAADNACATLASGMTESITCSRTPPTSIRRLD